MIKTKRLEIVPFDVKYAKDLLELWSDFEVVKYTFTPLITTEEDCRRFIEIQISRANKEFLDRFIITLDQKAIGIVGCVRNQNDPKIFEIYYQIVRRLWEQGYAKEAAQAIMNYVYEHYPDATIQAIAARENQASLALLKKLGLKQTHIQEKGFNKHGFEIDLVHFSSR